MTRGNISLFLIELELSNAIHGYCAIQLTFDYHVNKAKLNLDNLR